MYIEATSKKFGDTAQLVSPIVNATERQCVEFYYHMYGKDINELKVLKREVKAPMTETPIWSLKGTQENWWNQGLVDINKAGDPYNVSLSHLVARWLHVTANIQFAYRFHIGFNGKC